MATAKIIGAMSLVILFALVSSAQTSEWREDGAPPTTVMAPRPQPPGGPGPMSPMRMRELADQLRARAREAQELSDRLRRQADELDQMAKRLMDRGPGPQQPGRFQPMPPGPRMEERQEIKKQIERLRDESRRAKEQGRMEDSERIWKEADRLEQVLREQGLREGGELRGPMPPEVQDILHAAEQAEREGRMEEARRQREKAEMVARELQEQGGRRALEPPGPREDERQQVKRKIEDLRNEAQKAKEQDRREDAERLGQEANRLEQQLREQGPKGQGPESPDRSFRDEVIRGMEGLKKEMGRLKKEMGRLWQAVNEMRNRPREKRQM
jgi:vacuolar-type H+-ATPase subunit I/STV1